MKLLIALLILPFVVCLKTNGPIRPDVQVDYYYVNNSSHSVVISSKVDSEMIPYKLDSIIKIGDTIKLFDTGYFVSPFGSSSKEEAEVKIIFDSTKCLTFSGDISQDSIVYDIRCTKIYIFNHTNKIESFYYIITDSLYDKAVPCN